MTFRHTAFIKIMKFVQDYILSFYNPLSISVIPCLNAERIVKAQNVVLYIFHNFDKGSMPKPHKQRVTFQSVEG